MRFSYLRVLFREENRILLIYDWNKADGIEG